MRLKFWIVLVLFVSSGIWYYYSASAVGFDRIDGFVVRVVDGDTFELEDGVMVRLLGINTPEKSMVGWEAAKLFLESMVLNKWVEIKMKEVDKYGRWLGYVFVGGKMVNEEILESGMGHLYVYNPDKWFGELSVVEEFARRYELGIWKKSSLNGCIVLVELKYEEDGGRCINGERLVLFNACGRDVDVVIKDEATHIYKETLVVGAFEKNFSCIWNDAGDSLFVWDSSGGLVLFWRY